MFITSIISQSTACVIHYIW